MPGTNQPRNNGERGKKWWGGEKNQRILTTLKVMGARPGIANQITKTFGRTHQQEEWRERADKREKKLQHQLRNNRKT